MALEIKNASNKETIEFVQFAGATVDAYYRVAEDGSVDLTEVIGEGLRLFPVGQRGITGFFQNFRDEAIGATVEEKDLRRSAFKDQLGGDVDQLDGRDLEGIMDGIFCSFEFGFRKGANSVVQKLKGMSPEDRELWIANQP